MAGKINVYNLGQKGVNVTKSPIHIDDGELTKGQNAQIDQGSAVGGWRKRDGMTRLNSAAMAGAGRGLIGLPLPDRSALTRYFYAPYDDRGGAASGIFWLKSSDGVTWSTNSEAARPQQVSRLGAFATTTYGSSVLRWCTLNDKFYYPGDDYNPNPTIHVYDGTTDYILCQVPNNPRAPTSVPLGVLSIVPYSSTKLIVTMFDTTTYVRVLLLDIRTGQMTQLGPESVLNLGGLPLCPVVFNGRIWIGTYNTAGGASAQVLWCRPGDDTWTVDFTGPSTHGYIHNLMPFKGLLYAGMGADVLSNGRIYERAATGVWSQVEANDGTGALNYYGPLIKSLDGGTLYAGWNSVSGGAAPQVRIMSSTDGTTWATAFDVSAVHGGAEFAHPIVDSNGDVYWVVGSAGGASTSAIIQNASGVYTVRNSAHQLRGPLCVLRM